MNEILVFKYFNKQRTQEKLIGEFNFSESGFNLTTINGTTFWIFPQPFYFRSEKDRLYAAKFPQYSLT